MALPLVLAVPAVVQAIRAVVQWFVVRRSGVIWSAVVSALGLTHGPGREVADAVSDGEWSELLGRFHAITAALINYYLNTELTADDFRDKQTLARAMGREVSGKSGILLRDITDRRTTEEDLENHALMMIEGKTGVKLSSLRNVELLKRDFARLAGSHISEKVGIPLSNILDPDITKAEVLEWAQDEVMIRIGDSVTAAVQARMAGGMSLLQAVKLRVGADIKPAVLLRSVNDAMAGRYIVRWEVYYNLSKADKRKVQLKIAQRRFRDRSNPKSELYDGRTGGRMAYVPKGWNAAIDPPNVPMAKLSKFGRAAKSALDKLKAKAGPGPTEAQLP